MGSQRRLLEALATRHIHGDSADAVMHAIEDLRGAGDDIADALWQWYEEGRRSRAEAVAEARAVIDRLEDDLRVIEDALDSHSERWAVACGCDKHGDHLGCTQDCQDNLGCGHPLGALLTAATEAEADRLAGL